MSRYKTLPKMALQADLYALEQLPLLEGLPCCSQSSHVVEYSANGKKALSLDISSMARYFARVFHRNR
jgi:hypothetical protein